MLLETIIIFYNSVIQTQKNIMYIHYSDVVWALMHLQSSATQSPVLANNWAIFKALHYWTFARGTQRSPRDPTQKGTVI